MIAGLLALCLGGPTPPPDASVVPFRTEAAPRVDPVFADAATNRARVDRFFALQSEMERVRDEFATAVHATLGEMAEADPRRKGGRSCPEGTLRHYARAAAAGGRYLALGRQLESRFRELRRLDELGDAIALTPDYRFRVKKARELYAEVLRDYREMRIAFYDQLGAEMRFHGCKLPGAKPADGGAPQRATSDTPDPADPTAWNLEDPAREEEAAPPPGPRAGERESERADRARPGDGTPSSGVAPAVWIDVDNSRCAEPTRVAIDGAALGEVPSGKRTSIRTRSGPHEICVLPASDSRSCGAPGTLRKAYLHEGWSISVRCDK